MISNHLLTSDSHFPHSCKQLDQPSVGVRQPDDDVGRAHAPGIRIDEREYKGRQRKGAQSQRRRVRELAKAGLVRAGLEGTTEGGHHDALLCCEGAAALLGVVEAIGVVALAVLEVARLLVARIVDSVFFGGRHDDDVLL